jgi:hypothetical protein
MLCNKGYGDGKEYGGVNGDGHGYGYGYGNRSARGYGHGYRYGEGHGNGDGCGKANYKSGNGIGDPHPTNKLSAKGVPEDPACTRLLSDDYPDINFYICQLKLMRGRK